MARPSNPDSERSTAARLTAELGMVVTRKCVQEWTAKGWDLTDTKKLRHNIRQQERGPKAIKPEVDPDSPELPPVDLPTDHLDIEHELKRLQRKLINAADYEEARTTRTKIAGVRDVLKSLREQDYYVTKESQIREGMQTGQTIKSLVLKIPTELPQMLVGLSYADSVEKCENYAYAILTTLHETGEIASG